MSRNKRLPDFEPEKKRSGALTRVLGAFLGWGVVFGCLVGAAAAWSYVTYTSAGPLTEEKIVILPRDAGRADIAALLRDNGVISDAAVMSAASLAQSLRGATLKPGEFAFPAKASMAEVFNIIASGRVVMHKLTVPEGWTSAMAVARIQANDILTGEIAEVPPEGEVAANTFLFPRGKDRQQLLDEMMASQAKLVDEVWATRPADSIITTKEAMVTLASIVEKETALPQERARVASVFLNRLKAGMRLQSDPTIIYGIVGGKGRLDRPLTRSDIDTPTAYNTYAINGLPPGPIGAPGRASLEAVLHPAKTSDLYFVADGSGGHAFAETLDAHNANVKKWREIEAAGGTVATKPSPAQQPDQGELDALNTIVKITQPALPEMTMPAPAVEAAAPEEAAVDTAAQDLQQATGVPEPAAAPPDDGASQAAADAPDAAPEQPEAESAVVLKPGTVMQFGERLIPIPALKKTR